MLIIKTACDLNVSAIIDYKDLNDMIHNSPIQLEYVCLKVSIFCGSKEHFSRRAPLDVDKAICQLNKGCRQLMLGHRKIPPRLTPTYLWQAVAVWWYNLRISLHSSRNINVTLPMFSVRPLSPLSVTRIESVYSLPSTKTKSCETRMLPFNRWMQK